MQTLQNRHRELAFKVDKHTFAHTITSIVQNYLSDIITAPYTRLPLSIVPPELGTLLNRQYIREDFDELDKILPRGWDTKSLQWNLEYITKLELMTNYPQQTLVLRFEKSTLHSGESIQVDICSLFKSSSEACTDSYSGHRSLCDLCLGLECYKQYLQFCEFS